MGMKDIRVPSLAERQSCTYWEAVATIHRVYGGIITPETAQVIALIYGREFLKVADDLSRGTP